MISERLFVGIESVGRRALVGVVSRGDGTILAAARRPGGFAFYTTPVDELVPQIRLLLGLLQDEIGSESWNDSTELSVAIGMTGVNSPFDAQAADYVLKQIEPLAHADLFVTGDAEIGFIGSAQSLTGSTIFASAGSVVASFIDGKVIKSGGWGPAFTDDGSAYQMGRDALRLVTDWYDHLHVCDEPFRYSNSSMEGFWNLIDLWMRYPGTKDFPDEPQRLGWANVATEWRRVRRLFLLDNSEAQLPLAIVALTYGVLRNSLPAWWNFVASLSIPILGQWEQDLSKGIASPSTEIVDRFLHQLIVRHSRLVSRSKCELSNHPCVLFGGLLNHHQLLSVKLTERIRGESPAVGSFLRMQTPGVARPVVGALLLALGKSDHLRLRLPSDEIMRHINDQLSSLQLKWGKVLHNE